MKIHTVLIISVSECSVNELGHAARIYICAAYAMSFSGICNISSLRYSKKNPLNKVEFFVKIKFMRTFYFGYV